MTPDKKINRWRTDVIILSLFGIGFFPKAPGTMGSLACVPLLYLTFHFKVPFLFLIPPLTMLFLASSFMAENLIRKFSIGDAQWIVIDEAIGMLTCWLFFPQIHWSEPIIAFILFRFFDIGKFGPVGYVDRKFKNGIGIILDDVVAGLMGGLTFLVLFKLFQNYF